MDVLISLLVLISGLILSYFVNFLCDVLPLTVEVEPRKLSLKPVCVQCKFDRTWFDFLAFRPCSHCGNKAPFRHWVVLLGLPIAFLLGYLYPPDRLNWWFTASLIVYFFIVGVIDISHRMILRSLTILGWILTACIGYSIHVLPLTLLGGASGLVVMLVLYYAGVLFSKFMQKRNEAPVEEALGFGDVYISIMAGFLLAFPDVFSALLLAILIGGIISFAFLLTMLARRDYHPLTAIPYAPFIILATIMLMYKQGM